MWERCRWSTTTVFSWIVKRCFCRGFSRLSFTSSSSQKSTSSVVVDVVFPVGRVKWALTDFLTDTRANITRRNTMSFWSEFLVVILFMAQISIEKVKNTLNWLFHTRIYFSKGLLNIRWMCWKYINSPSNFILLEMYAKMTRGITQISKLFDESGLWQFLWKTHFERCYFIFRWYSIQNRARKSTNATVAIEVQLRDSDTRWKNDARLPTEFGQTSTNQIRVQKIENKKYLKK